jgi:hypothetical protein
VFAYIKVGQVSQGADPAGQLSQAVASHAQNPQWRACPQVWQRHQLIAADIQLLKLGEYPG